ncbi:MAG: hypothetical protein OXP66_14020, partial [Candidatus Tectomicrobia bacterium]|nr:hypothetical protein [Candidatus Tectomicrobia bacterium]
MLRLKQLLRLTVCTLLAVGFFVLAAGTLRAQEDETAEEVFHDRISEPIVQSKCVNCHVQGGLSGNTRLVFVRSSDTSDHAALNLRAFEDAVGALADEGGGNYILNKIQG